MPNTVTYNGINATYDSVQVTYGTVDGSVGSVSFSELSDTLDVSGELVETVIGTVTITEQDDYLITSTITHRNITVSISGLVRSIEFTGPNKSVIPISIETALSIVISSIDIDTLVTGPYGE